MRNDKRFEADCTPEPAPENPADWQPNLRCINFANLDPPSKPHATLTTRCEIGPDSEAWRLVSMDHRPPPSTDHHKEVLAIKMAFAMAAQVVINQREFEKKKAAAREAASGEWDYSLFEEKMRNFRIALDNIKTASMHAVSGIFDLPMTLPIKNDNVA